MPLDGLDVSLQAIGDIQCLPFFTSKAAVGQINALRTRHNPRFRRPIRIQHKDRPQTRMTNEQTTLFVHSQPVRAYCPEALEE